MATRPLKAALLHPLSKPVLFTMALLPFFGLCYGAVADTLGANPAEALLRQTGDWVLRFICLTLSVTPLRQITGLHAIARLRRMLGLFAYFYGLLHFVCYAWFDMGFVWTDVVRDIGKRPFILVGSAALLLMTPLAATSFNQAIKALGAKRWQWLHRAVYLVALLGLLHFFWMRSAKSDFAEVIVYGFVIAALLGWRLGYGWRSLYRKRKGT